MNRTIQKFQRFSDYCVLDHNGIFFIFAEGNNDSIVISGPHREKISKNKIVRTSTDHSRISQQIKNQLIEATSKIWELSLGTSIASFSILSGTQKKIRDILISTNSTHIEFNCDENNAKAFPFDISAADGNVLWRKSFIEHTDGIQLSNFSGSASTFVMKAETFLALPNETFSFSIYQNDYAIITLTEDGSRIYVRDQNIRKPYTSFLSGLLAKKIVFSFHPKS